MDPVDTGYVSPYAARIAAAQERLTQPIAPRYTPQEQDQRIMNNAQGYGLGLAAQLSGEDSLAQIGRGVAWQADKEAANKVTDKGVFDPLRGTFTYDPAYQQETQRTELNSLQDKEDQSRVRWQEQRQRADEHKAELKMQWQLRADAAAQAAQAHTDTQGVMKQNQIVNAEQRANGQFMQQTTKYRGELGQAENIINIVGNTPPGKMDATTQNALVQALNHMTDFGSVVREGEFARTAQAQGFVRNAIMTAQKIQNGKFLDNQTIQSIKGLAEQYKAFNQQRISGYAKDYAGIASRQGLNPLNVVGESYAPSGITVVPDSGAPAAPAPAAGRVLPQATAAAQGRTAQGAPNGRGQSGAPRVVTVDY